MKRFSKKLFILDSAKMLDKLTGEDREEFKKDIEDAISKEGWATQFDGAKMNSMISYGLKIEDEWCYDDEGKDL